VSNLLKKEKGFTLIEIVLVLAIAGLIMVIVFLALSGAQKNRRDTQRKEDNSRVMSQLESYASNNGGNYPTAATFANFTGSYLASGYTDPLSGNAYTYNLNVAPACTAANYGTVYIQVNGRTVTSTMCLEQGSQVLTNQ
jgi:prepilin-type N-terminal cleavage/methylation domain-containing protein